MLYVFGIYDKKLGEYGPQLFCERNSLMVLRNLGDSLKRVKDAPMAVHAEDFDVMCLGEVDEQSGVLTPYPTCRFVENVANLLRAEVPEAGVRSLKKEA